MSLCPCTYYYSEPDWDPIAEARVKLEMAHVFKAIGTESMNS